MEITNFTIQIIILGIPGIFCYFISSKLVGKIGKNNLEEFLAIFLFSILSYALYSLGIIVFNFIFCVDFNNEVFNAIFKSQPSIKPNEVIGATLTSIFLAFLISYLYNYNLLNSLARFIKATNRYGDEDVWHYLHTNYLKDIDWFVIRDLKNDIMYLGKISTYSETEKDRELLIKNADVYRNSTGELMYGADDVYVCIAKNDITIEVNPKTK